MKFQRSYGWSVHTPNPQQHFHLDQYKTLSKYISQMSSVTTLGFASLSLRTLT